MNILKAPVKKTEFFSLWLVLLSNFKHGGTGLGLSIAKWIIDNHKGYFSVLSRKEIGTRITVFLPQNKI